MDKSSDAQTLAITLHNISTNGIAFWTRQEILPSTTFFIREFAEYGRCPWVEVDVTHCTPGIRGFLIGAEFRHPVPKELLPSNNEQQQDEVPDAEDRSEKGRGLWGWLGL